jgi:hypothetical protein
VTAVGNAQISTAQSKFGGASIAFDGTGDYLTASNNSAFSFGTGNFTIEAWLYSTAHGGGFLDFAGCLVDTRGTSTASWPNGILVVLTTNGSLRVFTDAIVSTSTAQIALNTWTHVAIVRIGSSVTFYINGQEAGTFTFSNNLSQQDMTIGAAIDLRAQDATLKYNGYIDDLRITKGVARYVEGTGANAGKMVFTGTNTLALPTTELPANITDDTDYNSVSLLLRNGTPGPLVPFDESPTPKTITQVGNAGISTTIFKYGTSSLSFDGNGDALVLPASSAWDFSGGPHTIECWLWLNAYPSGAACRAIRAGENNFSSSFVFLNFNSGSGVPSAARPLSGSAEIAHSSAIPLNQWTHYALVLNGATTRMFVDGVGVTAAVTMPTSTSGNALVIGYDTVDAVNAQLNGFIDDLRITKGVARYTKNFLPAPAQLPAI